MDWLKKVVMPWQIGIRTSTVALSSCKQTLVPVTMWLCYYCLETSPAEDLIHRWLTVRCNAGVEGGHSSPVSVSVLPWISCAWTEIGRFKSREPPLFSKLLCDLTLTASEMQITAEAAFVQQQHRCSRFRELQTRHTAFNTEEHQSCAVGEPPTIPFKI